jgi:hypothetical protein
MHNGEVMLYLENQVTVFGLIRDVLFVPFDLSAVLTVYMEDKMNFFVHLKGGFLPKNLTDLKKIMLFV